MTLPMPQFHFRDRNADHRRLQQLVAAAQRSHVASGGPLVDQRAGRPTVYIDDQVRGGILATNGSLYFSPQAAAALAEHLEAAERDHRAVPSAAANRAASDLHRAMTVHHGGDNPFAEALRASPTMRRRFLEGAGLANVADVQPPVTHRRAQSAAETLAFALSRTGKFNDPEAALQALAGTRGSAQASAWQFLPADGPLAQRLEGLRTSGRPGDLPRYDAYMNQLGEPVQEMMQESARSGAGDPVETGKLSGLKAANAMRERQISVSEQEGLITARESGRQRASLNVRSAFKASLHLRGLAKLAATKWLTTASFRYAGVHVGQGLASGARGAANAGRWAGHWSNVRRDPQRDRGVGDSHFAH